MNKIVKLLTLIVFVFLGFTATSSSAYFQQNEHCVVTSVRASHILVDTKAEANLLKSKIDNGESFESLAKKYSKCPSGQEGGNLGYFRRGQMVKEFEDAAFNLPIGKVSEPVRTEFGWHLIKVTANK